MSAMVSDEPGATSSETASDNEEQTTSGGSTRSDEVRLRHVPVLLYNVGIACLHALRRNASGRIVCFLASKSQVSKTGLVQLGASQMKKVGGRACALLCITAGSRWSGSVRAGGALSAQVQTGN